MPDPASTTKLPHHDELLQQYLQSFLGQLEPAAMALLRETLQWQELAGGEVLMEQGAPGDAMYMVVSGRLRAYIRQDDGHERAVREMGRGQIVGEMSLYTDEPRTATVVAIRDSVLVRLDKAHFMALLESSTQVSLALTRQIIRRHQAGQQPLPLVLPVTIALVPVSAGVDASGFARRFAAALGRHGRVAVVDAASLDGGADRRSLTLRLDEIEAAHDFVLLVADEQPTEWTWRCSRHSDELLLLADARAEPALHLNETGCLMKRPPRTEAAEILVLLHPADAGSPRGTARWLDRRPVAGHLHVRVGDAADLARLARVAARQAVGLVLAGGGARGFAHLGVVRALRQRGIEIDFVGGTSIGAVMGFGIASGRPLEDFIAIARRAFVGNPTGDWNLLPMLSLFRGLRLKRLLHAAIHELLGAEVDIEDLWLPFFCIATNYSQASEQVLSRGPLLSAVQASCAIPGALPPVVIGGELMCDGGTFNNFPVDVMRAQRGVGRVIGVDLAFSRSRRLASDEVPGPWALLRDRLRPAEQRRWRFPSLATYLVNVTVLHSVARQRRAQQLADLVLRPALDRVGLLSWERFDDILRQGQAHADAVLDAREPPAFGAVDWAVAGSLPLSPAAATASSAAR
jgi:NTE family protein